MRPPESTGLDSRSGVARRVAGNGVAMAAAEVASKAMVFVFYIVAARHLGTGLYGVFSLSLAFVSMFQVLGDLGVGVITAREIARDRSVAYTYVSNSLSMRLIAGGILAAAVTAFVAVTGYPARTVGVTAICGLFIPATSVAFYYTFVFQGFERMVYIAWTRVTQTAVLVGGALVLSRFGPMPESYAWLYVVAAGASALVALAASTRFVRPGLGFNIRFWGRLLKVSLPVGLAAVLSMLYYWNGSAVLSKMRGDAEVGIFSASFRLVLGMAFIAFAFAGAVYPLMCRLRRDPERLRMMTTDSVRYMIVCGVPVSVLALLMAGPIIGMLYGPQYAHSAASLRALSGWGVFLYLNCVLSNYFYAVDRPGVVAVQTALSLCVNLAANFLLIPESGAIGASYAVLLAEAAGCAFLIVFQLRTSTPVRWGRAARSLPAAIVAAALAGIIGERVAHWNVPSGLAVALGVYAVLVVALGGLDNSDLSRVKMILSRTESQLDA